jgi:hypothetical protein
MENRESTQNTLVDLLSDKINDYTSANKSLRQLARYSCVAYSYIRRLQQKEITEDKLNPVKVFQLLSYLDDKGSAITALSSNQDWLHKIKVWTGFNDTSIIQKTVTNSEVESVITSDDNNIIAFTLASNSAGVSVSFLKEVGGMMLIKAAEILTEKGILKFENNSFKTSLTNVENGEFFSFTREGYKRIIPALVRFYNVENSGQNRNYIYTATESLSKEFIHEFFQKVEELRQWYSINSRRPESSGSNPFFFSMFMDSFNKNLNADMEVMQ